MDQENVPEIAEHSFVHHSFNGVKAEGKDVHLVQGAEHNCPVGGPFFPPRLDFGGLQYVDLAPNPLVEVLVETDLTGFVGTLKNKYLFPSFKDSGHVIHQSGVFRIPHGSRKTGHETISGFFSET